MLEIAAVNMSDCFLDSWEGVPRFVFQPVQVDPADVGRRPTTDRAEFLLRRVFVMQVQLEQTLRSHTDDSSGEVQKPDDENRVLKLLHKGNMEEASRREEQARKANVVSQQHSIYKQTR